MQRRTVGYLRVVRRPSWMECTATAIHRSIDTTLSDTDLVVDLAVTFAA